MKYSLLVFIISLLFHASASAGEANFYIKPLIGVQISEKYPQYNGSISFGYNVNKNFSTELQLQFSGMSKSIPSMYFFPIESENKTLSTFWNQYYNFDTKSTITPYIMFAPGISSTCFSLKRTDIFLSEPSKDIKSEIVKSNIKNTFLAYSLGAGIKLDAGNNFSFDISYRISTVKNLNLLFKDFYSDNCQATISNPILRTNYSHSINLGLEYNF